MDISVTFRNLDSSDALKDHALEMFERVKVHIIKPESAHAHIILSVENKHAHKAEITLSEKDDHLVATDEAEDMYHAIDNCVHKLITQLKKHKDKIQNHHS